MDLDPKTDLKLTRTLKAPRALIWECWTCLLYTSPSPRDRG